MFGIGKVEEWFGNEEEISVSRRRKSYISII